jgi:hypothetical protein
MIRAGDLVCIMPDDIDQFRSAGLDATGVRTIEEFGASIAKCATCCMKVRPHVLENLQ